LKLELLYEKEIIKKKYKLFLPTELDQSFDMLISIGGDGTILRATLIRDSGIPILGINRKTGFGNRSKKTSMNFYKLLSKKNIRFLKEHY
jgi:NAD kinase